MNPDVTLRLKTLMRAMSEVVIPAIDDDNSLAQEQGRLVLGHLNALLQHHAGEAELVDRDTQATRALAHALLDAGRGGGATEAARETLLAALKDDGDELGHAIEGLVLAIGVDGEASLHTASTRLVMAHAAAQNFAGRAWFKPMGFDGAPDTLPEPTELLQEPPV